MHTQLIRRLRPYVLLALMFVSPAQARAADTVVAGNCRFGVTLVTGSGRDILPELRVGAYLDWSLAPRDPPPQGVDFIHVVRLRNGERQFVYDPALPDVTAQFESSLQDAIKQYPGQAWLVGNEPDTTFETQDALTPDEDALAYGHVYQLIKSTDPTARVGIGTIVQPTPLRLRWLEKMWAAYQ